MSLDLINLVLLQALGTFCEDKWLSQSLCLISPMSPPSNNIILQCCFYVYNIFKVT
jgi:hypothetical protein